MKATVAIIYLTIILVAIKIMGVIYLTTLLYKINNLVFKC